MSFSVHLVLKIWSDISTYYVRDILGICHHLNLHDNSREIAENWCWGLNQDDDWRKDTWSPLIPYISTTKTNIHSTLSPILHLFLLILVFALLFDFHYNWQTWCLAIKDCAQSPNFKVFKIDLTWPHITKYFHCRISQFCQNKDIWKN